MGIYTLSDLHDNIVALLNYDHSNQVVVVEEIQAFICMMVHKFVADMVRLHRDEQLAELWYQVMPRVDSRVQTMIDVDTYTSKGFYD